MVLFHLLHEGLLGIERLCEEGIGMSLLLENPSEERVCVKGRGEAAPKKEPYQARERVGWGCSLNQCFSKQNSLLTGMSACCGGRGGVYIPVN